MQCLALDITDSIQLNTSPAESELDLYLPNLVRTFDHLFQNIKYKERIVSLREENSIEDSADAPGIIDI